VSSILSGDDLSISGRIIVDGSFGGSCGDEFSCLSEVDAELRGEDRRGLSQG